MLQPMVAYTNFKQAVERNASSAAPVARTNATLAVASIAALMTAIDSGVLTTGIPSLHAEFGGSVGDLEWTTNAYNLAFGCLLIVAAGLGERIGRRRRDVRGHSPSTRLRPCIDRDIAFP